MKELWTKYKDEYRKLLELGGPILVTQLSVIALAFSDTIMVGHYSVNALAAAAFVNSLFLVPNVMLMGLSGGLTPMAGALHSQKNPCQVGRVTSAAMQVNLLVALAFTALEAAMYFLLDHFGQPADLMPETRSYYLVLLLVPLPMTVYNVIMQMCNGIENPSLPMWITLFCILFNILGNWLLIYGVGIFPELGLLGAGIATVTARIVGALAIVACFWFQKRYGSYREGVRHAFKLSKERIEVWRTSWPLMLQGGFECGLWSLSGVVIGWFGAVQLAAYQVVNTISQLGFMIYMSFTTAVAIRVAYYAGLRNEAGAGAVARAGMHINLILATLASLAFWIFGEHLINLFINTGEGNVQGDAVVASAMALILPLVVYQYFDALQLTFCNAIRGTGQVKPLFWISLTSYIFVGIPFLFLFAVGFDGGNIGAYWSFNIALLTACAMSIFIFRRIRFN